MCFFQYFDSMLFQPRFLCIYEMLNIVNLHLVNADKVSWLHILYNSLHCISAAFYYGYLELEGGWITPLDGFQYKLVTTAQSWQRSRNACQRMGGDLATHGVQNWVTRR